MKSKSKCGIGLMAKIAAEGVATVKSMMLNSMLVRDGDVWALKPGNFGLSF